MHSAAFEVKQTRTNSIAFDAVKEHQRDALGAAWTNHGLIHKISDQSQGYKPCDIMYLRNASAYVVVKFPKFFVLITASDWGREARESQRKSLTGDRAKAIAYKVVEL